MANVTVIVGTQWGNEGKGRIAHHVLVAAELGILCL